MKINVLSSFYFSLFAISLTITSSVMAKPYKSAEIYSFESELYGRYVMRMRAAKGSGVLSNFFLWKNDSEQSDVFWQEVDIEIFGKDDAKSWQSNVISGLNPLTTSEAVHQTASSFADAYHTFTLEWIPGEIRWFVDGTLVRRANDQQIIDINMPSQARFNFWPTHIASWAGPWDPSVLPLHMFVNWVEFHSWNGDGFDLKWRDDFDEFDTQRWGKANWTFDANEADFAPENALVKEGYLVLAMTREGEEGYTGTPPVDNMGSSPEENTPEVQASCRYRVDNHWGAGAVAYITLENTSSQPISDWSVSWQYDDGSEVVNYWQGNVAGESRYTATPQAWARTILPGGKHEIGLLIQNGDATAYAIPVLNSPICTTN